MPRKPAAAPEKSPNKVIATNRRARFDYEILETFEAGIALVGSEVKSLRAAKADLKDSYAAVERGEMWLHGVRIQPYEFARDGGHEPERSRKLLLHKGEILRIGAKVAEKGLTVIPVRLYFKEGKAKVELGLVRGKTQIDKRDTIKQREADRDMQRAVRHRDRD